MTIRLEDVGRGGRSVWFVGLEEDVLRKFERPQALEGEREVGRSRKTNEFDGT